MNHFLTHIFHPSHSGDYEIVPIQNPQITGGKLNGLLVTSDVEGNEIIIPCELVLRIIQIAAETTSITKFNATCRLWHHLAKGHLDSIYNSFYNSVNQNVKNPLWRVVRPMSLVDGEPWEGTRPLITKNEISLTVQRHNTTVELQLLTADQETDPTRNVGAFVFKQKNEKVSTGWFYNGPEVSTLKTEKVTFKGNEKNIHEIERTALKKVEKEINHDLQLPF